MWHLLLSNDYLHWMHILLCFFNCVQWFLIFCCVCDDSVVSFSSDKLINYVLISSCTVFSPAGCYCIKLSKQLYQIFFFLKIFLLSLMSFTLFQLLFMWESLPQYANWIFPSILFFSSRPFTPWNSLLSFYPFVLNEFTLSECEKLQVLLTIFKIVFFPFWVSLSQTYFHWSKYLGSFFIHISSAYNFISVYGKAYADGKLLIRFINFLSVVDMIYVWKIYYTLKFISLNTEKIYLSYFSFNKYFVF